jgi:glycosyltransferase involved in cell wall biosynthesis
MHIVIGHFHLQTGGVTRVIEHACSALLAEGHRVLVVAGEPPQRALPAGAAFALVPALAYEERRRRSGADELAAELECIARDHFGGPPDLWHIHNHSLGKNLAVPGALIELAKKGQRLLLQPHDFAEDGRPALYARLLYGVGEGDPGRLAGRVYPLATHIHYAVLTDRDRSFLAVAGIPEDRLHLLPNAVAMPSPPTQVSHPFENRRLWLYPTRAIRRKNLGELLLWSVVGSEGDVFAATQAPQNPAEQPGYRRWAALAAELRLPVELELGHRIEDFAGLLASAHALVTTSVAEGFGLAFLEPWLVGRPLVGRDLPEITRDFTAAGIDLGGLYERLEVPLEWLDAARLRRAMNEALERVMSAYGREGTPDDVERLWSAAVSDGRIDFGRLDETAQEEVIRHLVTNPDERGRLRPPALDPGSATAAERIARNRTLVERDFSIAGYGRRLTEIYARLLAEPVAAKLESADGGALLDRFLAPERLFLLRS